MNPEDRKNEFTKRQMWVESSMVCKLNSVNGFWHYKVYAWIDQGEIDNKSLVLEGRYNGEDPVDLIQAAILQLGIKKIKCGRPIA